MRQYEEKLLSERSVDLTTMTSAQQAANNEAFEKLMARKSAQRNLTDDRPPIPSSSSASSTRRLQETSAEQAADGWCNPYVAGVGCNPNVGAASTEDGKSSMGKELLPDRARTLKACPKSAPSKSKWKQFEETWGYKKARGGKCRHYYAGVYERDP